MISPPGTRWPTVGRCSCSRLEVEHKLIGSGWSTRRGGTDDGSCPGYREEAREERPPESELRRRLDEILLRHLHGDDGNCEDCLAAYPCPTVRIARGEDVAAEGGT